MSRPLHLPDWSADAACIGADPEIFFPEKGGSTRAGKAVCATCPVTPQCLELALTNHENYGIWGGLAERERRHLRIVGQERAA